MSRKPVLLSPEGPKKRRNESELHLGHDRGFNLRLGHTRPPCTCTWSGELVELAVALPAGMSVLSEQHKWRSDVLWFLVQAED